MAKKKVENVDNIKNNEQNVSPKWYIFRVQTKREELMIKLLRASFSILEKDGVKADDYFVDFSIPKHNFVE